MLIEVDNGELPRFIIIPILPSVDAIGCLQPAGLIKVCDGNTQRISSRKVGNDERKAFTNISSKEVVVKLLIIVLR